MHKKEDAVECRFKSVMEIGGDVWDWCDLFNAQIKDLNCQDCEHSRLPTAVKITAGIF